ncbi:MAG TPA: lysylphosphatidylglycerol synthase domain-containing protein [Stellaceae bacterium]|nr:lysylphosphatidylglycerol synthase domain-containing protein [Stellaceae bacterium]
MIRAATILGLFGIALFTCLIIYEGAAPVGLVLLGAGFGLVWASAFHVVPMVVNAQAWRVLFVAGPAPSLAQMTFAVWIRESVNGLLPVARIGGEVVSYRVLTRMGFKPVPVAASLISDITLSMVSQFLYTVAGLVMLLVRIEDAAVVWRVTGGLLVFIPMLAGMFAIQRIGIVNLGARLVGTLFGDRWSELVGNASRLDRVLRLVYRRLSRVMLAVGWQLLGWFLGTGEIWLALRYLGHPVDLYDAFLLESTAQAISSAAFVVPGAIGVQEGGFMLFGTMLGLDPEVALAVALARRIRDILVFVPGLVLWQIGEARRLAVRHPAE